MFKIYVNGQAKQPVQGQPNLFAAVSWAQRNLNGPWVVKAPDGAVVATGMDDAPDGTIKQEGQNG